MKPFSGIEFEIPVNRPITDNIKRKAIAYYTFIAFGIRYYIPITKIMTRLFGCTIKRKKISYYTPVSESLMRESLSIIAEHLILQIRETVGRDVYISIKKEIERGLEHMYEDKLKQKIQNNMKQNLLKE